MKTLLIMRHAKSSWDDEDLADFDRPLNKRGQKDAPRMGQLLIERQLEPDRILSSPALRARTTAQIVAGQIQFAGEVTLCRDFYHGEPRDYLDAVAETEASAERVMVVGHNPGLEELVARLTGANEFFPTAAIAVVELAIANWPDLGTNPKGKLLELYRPKEL